MALLFVYGTLKRGDCRHGFMAGARFVSEVSTQPGYRLFNLGEYPALQEDAAGGVIRGELYEVDAAKLELLDEVEGVADQYYDRRVIRLAIPFSDCSAEAYLYLGSVAGKKELFGLWVVPKS